MKNKKTRRLAVGGLMAALIAALTAYVRISIPGGYLNPGDAAVAMAGVLLGGELPEGTEAYLAANDSAYLRCAVFACKDKDAAAAVKKLIQTYIDDSIDAKYNVDEVALLQNAKIHSMGNYVAVAVTSDTDNVNKVIDQYFA